MQDVHDIPTSATPVTGGTAGTAGGATPWVRIAPRSGPATVDRHLIETALARNSWRLRFPRGLEAFFERETAGQRCRSQFHMGLFNLGLLALLLLPLKLMLGDIFGQVVLVQLAIVMPLNLLALLFLRSRPRPIWRELSVVFGTLVAVAGISWLAIHSLSPHRWAVPQIYTLALLYITTMQRLRFLPALIACVLMAAADLYLMSQLPHYDRHALAFSTMVFLGAVVCALTGTFASERLQRQRYLLSLLTRQQNVELDRLSNHDPLTGLGNRRLLDESLERIRRTQAQQLLSVILLDIDHFKLLNDAAGHQAGDRCLARIANLIQGQLRGQRDQAFRYGGEEFVLLLHDTPHAVALDIAERVRTAIESAGIRNPGLGLAGRITASLGVASSAVSSPADAERLLALADQALYCAKGAGRNTVFCALLDQGGIIVSASAA